ncbi:uncharacterized protein KY384_001148 [Bacidia gigantensis]|uniref:uncharacterized protein n=1 Tax=Bacidia gigantensis TaxID=2732470 RepID=UPI001D056003|nr:uncharacterized protein KY384_001148 [Bacidia gigantensis]KAG8534304.1 hypothetical protein KY384_001148 [Bacidia gigantensis]
MHEKATVAPSRTMSNGRDIKWIEGLRGVAAVGIAFHHVTLTCWRNLENAAESKEELGSIFYLPPFRMFAFGHGWLSLFFLLIGFVNSYKPIKLARRGEIPAALTGLNSSAFRRTWRFVLPPMLATVIAWALVNVGMLEFCRSIKNEWLNTTTPGRSGSFPEAIKNLFYAIYSMWAGVDFYYEKNLWVMRDLLMASFYVYLVLLATIRCSPKCRMTVFFGLYAFEWCRHESESSFFA